MKEAIAILTGGGPAPGMNTVVGSVAKTFLRKGYRVIGLHEGYTGALQPVAPHGGPSTTPWPTASSTREVRSCR